MRGRPPTPTEQKIDTGNPGGRPLPEVVVGLGKVSEFEKPDRMSHRQEQIWDEVVPQIMELSWIDQIDRMQVIDYVRALSIAEQAAEELERGDLVELGAKGGSIANPLFRIWRDAAAEARQIADRFGFNPSARARLGLTAAKGMSIAQDLEKRIGGMDDVPETIEVPVD